MSTVTVTISGPVGSGKSAVMFEIACALRAIGLEVQYAKSRAAEEEINGGFGDTYGAVEMYKPRVILAEVIER